jgi:hypothetical protein
MSAVARIVSSLPTFSARLVSSSRCGRFIA